MAVARKGTAAGASGGRVGRADDAGTQLLELAVDVLIPPLNVMRAVDERPAIRRQRGEDQRGPGTQIADRRLRAMERRGTVDRGVVRVLDVDVRAELPQLREPLDPVLEDRLVDA